MANTMSDNLPPLPEFEKWLRSVCFQAPPDHAKDLARSAWIEADKQASADCEAMAEEIERLQKALAFWMPDVPPTDHPLYKRVANDVYLLVGFDGPNPEPSAFELGHVALAESHPTLWAIHVPGPDDYYPAPSEEAANHMASRHNAAMSEWNKSNPDTSGNRPPIESSLASAQRWPGSAADHAEEIAVFDYAAWGLASPQPQPVQPTNNHLEEIYAYLCSTSPKGYADEAFRNVPDSLLSDSVRDRLAEQGPSLGQNARAIPEHVGSPEGADGRDGQSVAATVAQPVQPPTEAATLAIGALVAAKNSLDWYRGICPQHVAGDADEMDQQIAAAIEAFRSAQAKPEQAAQPGQYPLHDDIQSVLFEVEQAIGNGVCPWQIEAAFEAYEAARRMQLPDHGIAASPKPKD